MDIPAPPQQAVRPAFAILLVIFVGLFSLLFGIGAAFESDAALDPTVRFLLPIALLAAPAVLAVRLRSLGVWTAMTGGALASGAVLVFAMPVAFLSPAVVGSLALSVAIAVTIGAGDPLVRARRRRPAPQRRDR
jgi:hypothetical protein